MLLIRVPLTEFQIVSYRYTITKSPVGTPFQIENLDLHNALSPVGTEFQIVNTQPQRSESCKDDISDSKL